MKVTRHLEFASFSICLKTSFMCFCFDGADEKFHLEISKYASKINTNYKNHDKKVFSTKVIWWNWNILLNFLSLADCSYLIPFITILYYDKGHAFVLCGNVRKQRKCTCKTLIKILIALSNDITGKCLSASFVFFCHTHTKITFPVS